MTKKQFPHGLRIIAYSDFYDIPDPKVWGDYWFKINLAKEFAKIGYGLSDQKPAVNLHLFGEPVADIPDDCFNIIWIHSHPDWVTPDILKRYDRIFCISECFAEKIRRMGFDAQYLMMPTNMKPLTRKKKYDIVFVGNTKKNGIRKVIGDLGRPDCRVKVWGWGWKGLIPDEWYGGEYYENGKLNELYSSAKIVLNDHHEDMRREGFINPRILDALASGAFVVSDRVRDMESLLGDSVAQYDTPDELRSLVNTYLRDEKARAERSRRGQDKALQYTFEKACSEISRHIESISDKL